MAFFKFKGQGTGTATPTKDTKKKEEPPVDLTPLEKMLQNAGPVRNDGTDKFFGLENFGNTCYCNSIVQALFYSEAFRNHVINYPPISDAADDVRAKVNVTIRPPMNGNALTTAAQGKKGGPAPSDAAKRRNAAAATALTGQIRPEDRPDAPEYKKKQAMMKGPILELSQQSSGGRYGMEECTFTGLKDIFRALIESQSRTGVLSPQRFLELFKIENESFQNQMHQDAHEFYGLVLNDVITNVEANAKRMLAQQHASLQQSVGNAVGASGVATNLDLAAAPLTGWVHDIFEGVLTSETKCLSCETPSQRDETFLDLSIDLEEHSSVTSCLGKFSAEEMLCERNKFHCDNCGGLQEAEKRMKIHKLPKVLTFHLKRFKWTEDFSRLQKLFHRVVYPYYLRLFNTTDDAEDPDRIYELYAVVVHIGGNAYHGHYVSVIKTKDRGWLLFDDEMVEPVDKHFVRNFFGDKPGMACAYVLFYQETTFEKMRAEQEAEGFDDLILSNDQAACPAPAPHENGVANGVVNGTPLDKLATNPDGGDALEDMPTLKHSYTEPLPATAPPTGEAVPLPQTPLTPGIFTTKTNSRTREERKREKKEAEAAEKARKLVARQEEKEAEAAEKARKLVAKMEEKKRKEATKSQHKTAEQKQPQSQQPQERHPETDEEKREKEMGVLGNSVAMLSRGAKGHKSMSKRSFSFLGKHRGDNGNGGGGGSGSGTPRTPGTPGNGAGHGAESPVLTNGDGLRPPEKVRRQFSLGLGRKKSGNLLS